MSGFDIENLMDSNAEETNDNESVESSEANYENNKNYPNQNLDNELLSMVKNISNQIEKAPVNSVRVKTNVCLIFSTFLVSFQIRQI